MHKNYFTVIYMKIATGNNTFPTNNQTTNELDTRVRVLRQKLIFQLLKKLPEQSLVVHYSVHKSSDKASPRPHPIYIKPIIMLSSHMFLGFPSFSCLKIKDFTILYTLYYVQYRILYGLFIQNPVNKLMLKFQFLHTIWNNSDIFQSIWIILRELLNFMNLI